MELIGQLLLMQREVPTAREALKRAVQVQVAQQSIAFKGSEAGSLGEEEHVAVDVHKGRGIVPPPQEIHHRLLESIRDPQRPQAPVPATAAHDHCIILGVDKARP
jgi:hypothetical protein